MSNLKVYKREELKETIVNRFFPRKLILSRSEEAFDSAVETAMRKLNDLVYLTRVYEFNISGVVMDMTQMDIPGIAVDKVMHIVPANDYYEIFSNFRLLLGNTFFKFNMLRNQDDFVEYLLSLEIHKQLTNRYRNYNINYYSDGDKIIAGESFQNVRKCAVFFLPRFDIKAKAWELYDTEEKFLSEYLEAVVLYREGRAQSELKITGVDSNADDMKNDGKEMMEKMEENYRRTSFARIGKRF